MFSQFVKTVSGEIVNVKVAPVADGDIVSKELVEGRLATANTYLDNLIDISDKLEEKIDYLILSTEEEHSRVLTSIEYIQDSLNDVAALRADSNCISVFTVPMADFTVVGGEYDSVTKSIMYPNALVEVKPRMLSVMNPNGLKINFPAMATGRNSKNFIFGNTFKADPTSWVYQVVSKYSTEACEIEFNLIPSEIFITPVDSTCIMKFPGTSGIEIKINDGEWFKVSTTAIFQMTSEKCIVRLRQRKYTKDITGAAIFEFNISSVSFFRMNVGSSFTITKDDISIPAAAGFLKIKTNVSDSNISLSYKMLDSSYSSIAQDTMIRFSQSPVIEIGTSNFETTDTEERITNNPSEQVTIRPGKNCIQKISGMELTEKKQTTIPCRMSAGFGTIDISQISNNAGNILGFYSVDSFALAGLNVGSSEITVARLDTNTYSHSMSIAINYNYAGDITAVTGNATVMVTYVVSKTPKDTYKFVVFDGGISNSSVHIGNLGNGLVFYRSVYNGRIQELETLDDFDGNGYCEVIIYNPTSIPNVSIDRPFRFYATEKELEPITSTNTQGYRFDASKMIWVNTCSNGLTLYSGGRLVDPLPAIFHEYIDVYNRNASSLYNLDVKAVVKSNAIINNFTIGFYKDAATSSYTA